MRVWLLPVAALGVLALAALLAQQQPPQPAQPQGAVRSDDPTRITVDVTRVDMLFTVTDKKGRFVTNLCKEDFEVIEGKKHQGVQEFNAESDMPLRLAMLTDPR